MKDGFLQDKYISEEKEQIPGNTFPIYEPQIKIPFNIHSWNSHNSGLSNINEKDISSIADIPCHTYSRRLYCKPHITTYRHGATYHTFINVMLTYHVLTSFYFVLKQVSNILSAKCDIIDKQNDGKYTGIKMINDILAYEWNFDGSPETNINYSSILHSIEGQHTNSSIIFNLPKCYYRGHSILTASIYIISSSPLPVPLYFTTLYTCTRNINKGLQRFPYNNIKFHNRSVLKLTFALRYYIQFMKALPYYKQFIDLPYSTDTVNILKQLSKPLIYLERRSNPRTSHDDAFTTMLKSTLTQFEQSSEKSSEKSPSSNDEIKVSPVKISHVNSILNDIEYCQKFQALSNKREFRDKVITELRKHNIEFADSYIIAEYIWSFGFAKEILSILKDVCSLTVEIAKKKIDLLKQQLIYIPNSTYNQSLQQARPEQLIRQEYQVQPWINFTSNNIESQLNLYTDLLHSMSTRIPEPEVKDTVPSVISTVPSELSVVDLEKGEIKSNLTTVDNMDESKKEQKWTEYLKSMKPSTELNMRDFICICSTVNTLRMLQIFMEILMKAPPVKFSEDFREVCFQVGYSHDSLVPAKSVCRIMSVVKSRALMSFEHHMNDDMTVTSVIKDMNITVAEKILHNIKVVIDFTKASISQAQLNTITDVKFTMSNITYNSTRDLVSKEVSPHVYEISIPSVWYVGQKFKALKINISFTSAPLYTSIPMFIHYDTVVFGREAKEFIEAFYKRIDVKGDGNILQFIHRSGGEVYNENLLIIDGEIKNTRMYDYGEDEYDEVGMEDDDLV